MSRVKVRLADNIARVIFIEQDATIGAKIGTDLLMPDGTLATSAKLAEYIGATSAGGATTAHRLLTGLTVGNDHPQYTRRDTLTTRGDLYARSASAVARLPLGTAGKVLKSNGTDPVWAAVGTITRGAAFQMSDGSALLMPIDPVQGVRIAQAGTIKKVSVFTRGGSGSCVLNIWKDTYANYPPVSGDSICASAKPTITSGIKYEDATLTGWTTAVSAGDVLAFAIESTSIFTYIAIQLDVETP